ncbi:MAG: hypothetical protein JSV04_03565 [Candidatus Heimdallarchaeota archaeon]|nr:MAG: hypothetical protein JSV04_03565 [Candidatus Heimdallarchaeota archaeon]
MKIYKFIIAAFLVFTGVVLLILVIILRGTNEPSSSTDSDFPFIVFIPIFIGAFVPIIAAIRRRR